MQQIEVMSVNSAPMPATPPGRILVVPSGDVPSIRGGFLCDREASEAVMRAFREGGVDLPVDLEHQTLGGKYASRDGSAPAMGWINSLAYVEGEGILANVDWTPAGHALISGKGYRYLSPVAVIRHGDGRIVALHSVGLTNKPAIPSLRAIVNKQDDACDVASDDLVAVRAAAEWDREPCLRAVCSRENYIAESLRQHASSEAADQAVANKQDDACAAAFDDSVAVRAAAEWDREPCLRAVCSRENYIAESLRQHANSEAAGRTIKANERMGRGELIVTSAAEWDRERTLQVVCCDRSSYIDGQLLAHGMMSLSDSERRNWSQRRR